MTSARDPAVAPAALDPAVANMTGDAALPRKNGELVFEAPWQGRALGMALAVVERLRLPWSEFQTRLIAAIAARPEAPYYECWVAALERLVVDHGVVAPSAIDDASRRVTRD
jgi:nitrile hydratase accessory protein